MAKNRVHKHLSFHVRELLKDGVRFKGRLNYRNIFAKKYSRSNRRDFDSINSCIKFRKEMIHAFMFGSNMPDDRTTTETKGLIHSLSLITDIEPNG